MSRLACLALLAAAAAGVGALPSIEGGPFLPYRVNRAFLVDPESGILGRVRLAGIAWDGARYELFEARVDARTERLDLAFYLDEEIRGLELSISGPWSEELSTLDLLSEERLLGQPDPEENARRERARALIPPLRLTPKGGAPPRLALEAPTLLDAGNAAANGLFLAQLPLAALAALGSFALASTLLLLIPAEGRGSRRRLAAIAAAALCASVFVAILASPRTTLYRASFPGSGSMSGILERRTERRWGWDLVEYAEGGESGEVSLVALSASGRGGVPLEDFAPSSHIIRLSAPPLIRSDSGVLSVTSEGFLVGWLVHGGN